MSNISDERLAGMLQGLKKYVEKYGNSGVKEQIGLVEDLIEARLRIEKLEDERQELEDTIQSLQE